MSTCSVCGDVEDHLLHTCNHCGKRNCPKHQLPENHVCIPSKADLSDDDRSSSTKWFSEKHSRKNVMADESRGETEMAEESDPHLEKTETKRPLDKDEIDTEPITSNTTYGDETRSRKSREAMNRRLSSNNSTSSTQDRSASTSPSPQIHSNNTSSDGWSLPGYLLVILLLIGLIAIYMLAAVM